MPVANNNLYLILHSRSLQSYKALSSDGLYSTFRAYFSLTEVTTAVKEGAVSLAEGATFSEKVGDLFEPVGYVLVDKTLEYPTAQEYVNYLATQYQDVNLSFTEVVRQPRTVVPQ